MTAAQPSLVPSVSTGCYSLEITTAGAKKLSAISGLLPSQTSVSITSLDGETDQQRLGAAQAIREAGFVPVPHLAARRFDSARSMENLLSKMRKHAQVDHVLVLAGDTAKPTGPYDDGLALIGTQLLAKYGVSRISIPGYPTGHPKIEDSILWTVLQEKVRLLRQASHTVEIMTQFSFDPIAVLRWIARVRAAGISETVRVGIPGPATAKSLLRFASICGVSNSARMVAKYGISLGNLLRTNGPERFIGDFVNAFDTTRHGDVRFHLFTFGGLEKTANWARGSEPSLCLE